VPGTSGFQTAWRETRTARHQRPLVPLFASVAWWDNPYRQAPRVSSTPVESSHRLEGLIPPPSVVPVQRVVLVKVSHIYFLSFLTLLRAIIYLPIIPGPLSITELNFLIPCYHHHPH